MTVALIVLIVLFFPFTFEVKPETQIASMPLELVIVTETPAEVWLDKLENCESGRDPKAVNPEDSDGTPSYGILQFKPSTFELFSKAYKIPGELMDPKAQRAIVLRMMKDPSVEWETQFPKCIEMLGRPPVL